MIITWLKIMYYKITKPAVRSRKRADTGADPHAPVHAMEACAGPTSGGLDISKCSGPEELRCYACLSVHATDSRGLMQTMNMKPGETIRAARVRELYERGIISVPDGFGDTYRLPQGIVPGSRLADMYLMRRGNARFPGLDKIRQEDITVEFSCVWCGHPEHPDGERCSMSAEGMPDNPDGSRFMCGCVAGINMIQSPERPADEIEYCAVCQHPWHGGNGAPCGVQVVSRMQDGGIRPCGCTGFVIPERLDQP